MADAEATALLRVKADTSQVIRETDKMGSSFGRAVDKMAVGLAKFNLALGGIHAGIGLVKDGLDVLRDVDALHKLERAVPVKAFQDLDKATGELWKRTDLLRFASRGLASDYKFTEAQMADVANAARKLADEGIGTLEQNSEKLMKAVEKGGEGLDDFGLSVKKTGDKVKDAAAVLEKLHGVASDGAISEETKAVAEMDRALEELALTLKETIGPVIKGLIELMTESFHEWDNMLGGIERRIAQKAQRNAEAYLDTKRRGAAFNADIQAAHDIDTRQTYAGLNPYTMAGEEGYYSALTAGMGAPGTGAISPAAKRAVGGKGGAIPVVIVGSSGEAYEGDLGGLQYPGGPLGSAEGIDTDKLIGGRNGAPIMAGTGYRSDLEAIKQREGMVKDLADGSTAAGAAYATLAGGITAAVDAAITGSDSIAKAAAKASAGVLKSLAMESTGRAIYEGALAIGSLAIGDPKGAALHGIAAGKFALAAAVTGGLAAGLGQIAGGGGGGGAAGGSAGPAGGGYTPGRGNDGDRGGGGETYIFQFGDGFYGDKKEVADAVAGAMRDHQRKGGRGNFNASFKG